VDDTWYNQVYHRRGGVVERYSDKWFYPSFCLPFINEKKRATNPFRQTLILTDGLCGGACAYFVNKLRYHAKAAVVALGGIKGEPMDITHHNGGEKLLWDPEVDRFRSLYPGYFYYLPTSASVTVNHYELYFGNEPIPRDFQRYEADIRLDIWNLDTTNLTSLYVISKQVLSTFADEGFWNRLSPLGSYWDGSNPADERSFPSYPTSSSETRNEALFLATVIILGIIAAVGILIAFYSFLYFKSKKKAQTKGWIELNTTENAKPREEENTFTIE